MPKKISPENFPGEIKVGSETIEPGEPYSSSHESE